MGVELLLLYLILTIVLGPGTIVCGSVIVLREKVRLSRRICLEGALAVAAGLGVMCGGFALTYFFWYMARSFPH